MIKNLNIQKIYSIESSTLPELTFEWFKKIYQPIHPDKQYLLIETNKLIRPVEGLNIINSINTFLHSLLQNGFNILMINY